MDTNDAPNGEVFDTEGRTETDAQLTGKPEPKPEVKPEPKPEVKKIHPDANCLQVISKAYSKWTDFYNM